MEQEKKIEEAMRATSSKNKKRPLSSARIQKRPQTSFNKTSIEKYQLGDSKGELDVLYLIMKTSPMKYDMNLVNEKFKKLNEVYSKKKIYAPVLSKTDELYYKYNILYGSKSNELIRSYSPKMRPQSASFSNFKKDPLLAQNDVNCFTEEEKKRIFLARCEDLNINPKENLESKFFDYCNRKCINRVADFTDCYFKLNSAVVLSDILKGNEKVAQLLLPKNCIGDHGVEALIEGIKDSLSIVSLNLQSNDITHRGGDIIFKALLNNHSIVSLNLSSLEGLNRNRLTADGVKLLEKVLKQNLYLEFLNLAGNSLKNEGLKYILTGLNGNLTLHVLDISNNEINAHGVNYFSNILKKSKIFELVLSENPIDNQGIDTISDCLNGPNLKHLRKLDVSNCKITFYGAFNLFVGLQNNKKIESLNLSQNNLYNEKFPQLKPILLTMNLKELKMANCKLGNAAAITIAEGSCNNSALKLLDISENKIDDKGFASFKTVPLTNFALEKFDVSKNSITDLSAREFFLNLSKNYALKTLNFFDNQLKNETGTVIIESLRQNKNLICINLKYNRMHLKVIDEIQKMLKHNSDNSIQKSIPNLKKEIRQSYITENDFYITENKIQDTGVHVKNLVERLDEEKVKYASLKFGEQQRVTEIDAFNDQLNEQIKEMEEKIRGVTNSIKLLQTLHNVQTENLNKEIAKLVESTKLLEGVQRGNKAEQENMKIQFENEIVSLNPDLKHSEERLTLAVLSSESVKRELDNKKALLEKLENQGADNHNHTQSPLRSNLTKTINNKSGTINSNEENSIQTNVNLLSKESSKQQKSPVKKESKPQKKVQDKPKSRPKSVNPMLRPKSKIGTKTAPLKKIEPQKPNI